MTDLRARANTKETENKTVTRAPLVEDKREGQTSSNGEKNQFTGCSSGQGARERWKPKLACQISESRKGRDLISKNRAVRSFGVACAWLGCGVVNFLFFLSAPFRAKEKNS